jgi:oligopeptide/dipeptide ABC transporter ATP-binding protein
MKYTISRSIPIHTAALLKSRLSMSPAERVEEPPLTGDPPNPVNPPSGCRFRTRRPFAEGVCESKTPMLAKGLVAPTAHLVGCHMAQPGSGQPRRGAAAGCRRGGGKPLQPLNRTPERNPLGARMPISTARSSTCAVSK